MINRLYLKLFNKVVNFQKKKLLNPHRFIKLINFALFKYNSIKKHGYSG
jgi:hypothetical protein